MHEGLFTLHKRVVLSLCTHRASAPMAQADHPRMPRDGSGPVVRPLRPLRPLHSAKVGVCGHGGHLCARWQRGERCRGGYALIGHVLLHRHPPRGTTRCLEHSGRAIPSICQRQISRRSRLRARVTRTVSDGQVFESGRAEAMGAVGMIGELGRVVPDGRRCANRSPDLAQRRRCCCNSKLTQLRRLSVSSGASGLQSE